MARDFAYTYDPEFDYTIDEKGNTFIALRKVDWGNKGEYKLDLRKYYASESGETMSKGVSFLTDEGPDELTKVLIETGYGNDAEIANAIIQNRVEVLARIHKALTTDVNLLEMVNSADMEIDYEEDEFYDPEELIA